ncbi:hypothetical protein [Sinorhizobium meliloti]|uniref:hypothetical protein n=1 Tax=Rhizobium meliloti TaxID=382 RepID=UPI000FDBC9ED|nr:hypothetical protein [Sinorhizobium meliloti]RVH21449.1 hypothetical protein CN216_00310 [Sinorhizobium meliloti]RVH21510.1 hypothetical protein CN216_00630 [Sinorhizobium meliloti]
MTEQRKTYIALAGAGSGPSPEGFPNEFDAASEEEAREMLAERCRAFGLVAVGVETCSFLVRER